MARKSRGRQKVEMVKMANVSNLQVTFCKRRAGLFKKASELCTLCGVDIAIVVFSPGNKVFSFGDPNVQSVLDRFVTGNPLQASGSKQPVEAPNANDSQLTQVLEELEMESKRAEELNQKQKETQSLPWWEKPIEELNQTQLNDLKVNLQHLKQVLTKHIESLIYSSALQYFPDAGNGTNAPALNNMLLLPPPHVVTPAPGPPLALPLLSGREMVPFDGFSNMNLMNMQTAPPSTQPFPAPKFSVGSSSNDGPIFNDSNFNYSGLDMLHTLVPPPPPPPSTATAIPNEVQQNLQQSLPDFTPGFNNGFY